jgi:hypothetical protein
MQFVHITNFKNEVLYIKIQTSEYLYTYVQYIDTLFLYLSDIKLIAMKRCIVFCFMFMTFYSFTQSPQWSKEDSTNKYEHYTSILLHYKNLTTEQRESISLCCLEETTKIFNLLSIKWIRVKKS